MQRKLLALLALSHLVTDINQGVLPGLLPVLIATHHLSYAATAGLVFGTNISSSVVQPMFGLFADKISAAWIMPLGIFLAGLGLAFAGVAPNYKLMFLAVVISGIGIAAFHPEGARFVNIISGEKKATGVSIFSTGGNLGFAVGPLISTVILSIWGLKGTLLLLIPVFIMAITFVIVFSSQAKNKLKTEKVQPDIAEGVKEKKDDWNAFSRLTVALSCRSAVFWSLNTFLPLYLINVLGQSKVWGSAALTILLTSGAMGTLIAGRLADRYGNLNVVRIGLTALIPMLFIFVHINNVNAIMLLLVPLGLILFSPFSPMVVLGQSYLPKHMGIASGVTLGLAVSIGGIVAPLLGWVADHYSIHTALTWVVVLPVLAAITSFTLKEPQKELQTEPVPQMAFTPVQAEEV